jgi:hypothetical protein
MSNIIQLISQDEKKNLCLNEKALEIIKNLEGDIAICVCVGQYRSGKSFLLKTLANKLNNQIDFKVDHGQDGFTKGCWMNSQNIKVKINNNKMTNLILIDTEVFFK